MPDNFEKVDLGSYDPSSINRFSKYLSFNRVVFFSILTILGSVDESQAQDKPPTKISTSERCELEAIYNSILRSLDYKKIDQLKPSVVDEYFLILKGAIENKAIAMEDIKEKIFPPMAYASGLYFSNNFLENVLPQRIEERKGMTDAYTESLRLFVSEGKVAKQHQAKHEQVFAAYVQIFGESIDFNKTSNLFQVWGIENMPHESEFRRDHKDAIDIYYPLIKEENGEHLGPPVLAKSSGIVIAAENDWKGEKGKKSYEGGGMGGKTGNGVIIFNPEKREYTYYAHFNTVAVKPGDIVEAGQVIGEGGNTGIDARKKCYGRHVHFEIHRYNKKGEFVIVPSSELYEMLIKRGL